MRAGPRGEMPKKPPGNRGEKEYWPRNERRNSAIAMLLAAFVCIAAIVAIAACIYESEQINGGTETTAIYKGYISYNEKKYPIIERDGKEYISNMGQRVRDTSYVGHAVTIRYDPSNPDRFRILWETPAGIE